MPLGSLVLMPVSSLVVCVPASLSALLLPSSDCAWFRDHFPEKRAARVPVVLSAQGSISSSLLHGSLYLVLRRPVFFLMVRSLQGTVVCLILSAPSAQHRAFY